MTEEPQELRPPSPEDREAMRSMTLALHAQMADLMVLNGVILKRLEDIQGATTQTQITQTRFSLEHEKLLNSVDDLMGMVKHTSQGLSLQVRDLRTSLRSNEPE